MIVFINHNLVRIVGLLDQFILFSCEWNFVKVGKMCEVMIDEVLSVIFGVIVYVEEYDCYYDLYIGYCHEYGSGYYYYY